MQHTPGQKCASNGKQGCCSLHISLCKPDHSRLPVHPFALIQEHDLCILQVQHSIRVLSLCTALHSENKKTHSYCADSCLFVDCSKIAQGMSSTAFSTTTRQQLAGLTGSMSHPLSSSTATTTPATMLLRARQEFLSKM